MKKIMFFVLLLTVTISAFGQSDVTKFLGIPVDGCELLTPKGMSFGDTNTSSLFLLLPIIAF